MTVKRSTETELRYVRKEAAELERQLNTLKIEAAFYKSRANQAETELAEWKKRFDLLLARTPESK